MQTISYRKNYLLIYFWQSLSIILGFLSLFVVIPYLSTDKILYGTYSVCTSLTIFFSYADFGFISAGLKFAAEYFIQGERQKEINMIGFVAFMIMTTFLLASVAIIVCAIFPNLLIPELQVGSSQFDIARYLLLILALSCPIMIGQRVLTMIFTIRVEDYKFQRISIVGSLLKILSVFYFFREGCYDLIGYYSFFQVVNLLVVIVTFSYVRRYGYNFKRMFQAFRFDRKIFDKVKRLSGTSLVMVIAMILYYELDLIVIANFLGIEMVASYAIALSVMAFVRTFMSLLYSPYSSRYNHYSGIDDICGLQSFLKKIIVRLSPMVCCPIIILSCLASPFVQSWVGEMYSSSALLISFMVLSFIPNFFTTPISSYFVAKEENARLIKLTILNVCIYWVGIVATVSFIGVYSFAVFKSLAPILLVWGYWNLTKRDFQERNTSFVSATDLFKALTAPTIIALISSFIAYNYMWYVHSKVALLHNLFLMGGCLALSMIPLLISNRQIFKLVRNLIKK